MRNKEKKKPLILIVDDLPVNVQVLSNHLDKEKYNISAALSGHEALKIAEKGDPDLILLDVMMPIMDGYEVCKKLKSKEKTKDIPVIFLTAKTEKEDIIKGFEVGAVDYISKPFNVTELLARVRVHLRLKQAEDELVEVNKSLEEKVKKRTKELEESYEKLKKAQEKLVHTEKLSALGEFASTFTHEINTPLSIAKISSSHLADKTQKIKKDYYDENLSQDEFEDYIELASETTQTTLNNLRRANELISSFKIITVDQASNKKRKFNVKKYFQEILTSLTPKLKNTKHEIKINCPSDLQIKNYPGVFSQIFINLIMNSVIHGFENKEKGIINIDIRVENEKLEIIYSDDGKGIPKKIKDKVFNKYFTTKGDSGGSGIGLYVIKDMIEKTLNGEIDLQTKDSSGVTFKMSIPI